MAEEKGIGLGVDKDGLEQKPTSSPYDAIVNDPEMEGLTLYEKKALLVNRELDSECPLLPREFFSGGARDGLHDGSIPWCPQSCVTVPLIHQKENTDSDILKVMAWASTR